MSIKLLPFIALGVVFSGVLYFGVFNRQNLNLDQPRPVPDSLSLDELTRLEKVERELVVLNAKMDALNPSPSVSTDTAGFGALSKKTTAKTVSPIVAPITNRTPLYIPLGVEGGSMALNWTTVDQFQIQINPADYPEYKGFQLEATLRVYQGNGKAFARLINTDDNTAVWDSEISTTSQNYIWLSSAVFNLPASKKTYKIQLKTLTGYEASIQTARLKVLF